MKPLIGVLAGLLVAAAALGGCTVPDRSDEAIRNLQTTQPKPGGGDR